MIFLGAPKGTRTPDLLLRRQLLYPPELQTHRSVYFSKLTKSRCGIPAPRLLIGSSCCSPRCHSFYRSVFRPTYTEGSDPVTATWVLDAYPPRLVLLIGDGVVTTLQMVGREGNDPSSYGFSDRRSDLISYRPILTSRDLFAGLTLCLPVYKARSKVQPGCHSRTG